MAGFTPASVVFPCHDRSQAWACAPQMGVGGDRRLRLFSLPLTRLRRGESPCVSGKAIYNRKDQLHGRAHLARHSTDVGKSSLGALLRKREVTGRDASLPAPLWAVLFELSARKTVGALPQTPQGTLSLDPARGNFPLDPFRAIELFSLPYFFRVLLFCFFPLL